MSQPSENSTSEIQTKNKARDFIIGFIVWLILNNIFLRLQSFPLPFLFELSKTIIPAILFVKQKNWIAFGVIAAIIVPVLQLFMYVLIGD